MLILFDHGAPQGVSRSLTTHIVVTAKSRGWEQLSNGDLLRAAEEAGFELLFTTDNNLRYQQNLTDRKIAIDVITGTTKWSRVQLHLDRIVAAINTATPGSYEEVAIPHEPKGPSVIA
jgi:hypothetical protein